MRDVVDAVLVEELLVDNPGSIRYDLVDPPSIRFRTECKSKKNCIAFVMALLEGGRERAGGGLLPMGRQEGRDFLLNSSLIRLIHLLYLYREVYLTLNQGFT